MTSDAVETAAQLIHQRHRAGTANVCGECREVARQVAEVLGIERLHDDLERSIDDLTYLQMQARNVLDHWRDGDGLTKRDKSELRQLVASKGYDGHMLAEELDELGERVW